MGRYMHRPGEWGWEYNIHGLHSDDKKYQAISFDYEGLAYQFWVNKDGSLEYWDDGKIYCKMIYPMESGKKNCLFTVEQIERLQDMAWGDFSAFYFTFFRFNPIAYEDDFDVFAGYNKHRETDRKCTLMWFDRVMVEFEISKLRIDKDVLKAAKRVSIAIKA